jgi:hypothetical protein
LVLVQQRLRNIGQGIREEHSKKGWQVQISLRKKGKCPEKIKTKTDIKAKPKP